MALLLVDEGLTATIGEVFTLLMAMKVGVLRYEYFDAVPGHRFLPAHRIDLTEMQSSIVTISLC